MSKPTYGQWIKYLMREWKHPGNVDDVITFAIRMASWATDGEEVYPSIPRLARAAGISERTAKRRKREAVSLGLFIELDKWHGEIRKLQIALPTHCEDSPVIYDDREPVPAKAECVKSVTPWVSNLSPNIIDNSPSRTVITIESECVRNDTLSSATGRVSEANDSPESSAGVRIVTPWVSPVAIKPWDGSYSDVTPDDIDPADILDEMNQPELVTHCVYCHCRTCERNRSFGWFPGSEKYVEPSEPCQCKDCRLSEPSTAVASSSAPNGAFSAWPASSIGAEMTVS